MYSSTKSHRNMVRGRPFARPLWTALALAAYASGCHAATTYYVDNRAGNDAHSGITPALAWSSLANVNQHKFNPGDKILLHAGQSWTGILAPNGSGTPSAPIELSSYDRGAKPLIKGGGASAAIFLNEVSHWTIRGVAVTNHGETVGIRNGIELHVAYAGVSTGLHLIDVDVTDVNGEVGSKSSGGIGVLAWGKRGKEARFHDVLIERCSVKDVDGQGIWFEVKHGGEEDEDGADGQYPNTNVRITESVIEDTGRNAIFLRSSLGAVIDHNVVRYAAARTHGNAVVIAWAKGTIIRENEVASTGRSGGGENGAFDADDGAVSTIIEYNWTHDNAGGSVNIVNDPRKKTPNTGTVVRFNLSENDKSSVFSLGGAVTQTLIHNNTVFVGKGSSPHLLSAGRFVSHVPGDPDNITFFNNVVYSRGSVDYNISATHVAVDSNCFFGKHPGGGPKDIHKAVAEYAFNGKSMPVADWKDISSYRVPQSSGCAQSALPNSHNGGRDIIGTVFDESVPFRGAVAPSAK